MTQQEPSTAFVAALTTHVASLRARYNALERERSRLDDWRTSGSDECRLLVQYVTDLQEAAKRTRDLIEQQWGSTLSDSQWWQLIRSLEALQERGDETAIKITAYSSVSRLLTVEALRQRKASRTEFSNLLFETRAIEEVLLRILAEQRATLTIIEEVRLLPEAPL